jgi:signal transduction histidine kinase
MASLRSRLLLGAVLWTIGLFIITLVVITAYMMHHPGAPAKFHGFFTHPVPLTSVALMCLAIGFAQVRRGMSPINQLRARLSAVHRGHDRRVEGTYPSEIQPLVDDLNALLAHREQMVRRALAKAGDLAHGLKTPLAVLTHEAERAQHDGQAELGAAIASQVERMLRHVEYHLAHARAAASGATPGARCAVAVSADALSRTMLRLHDGRGLTIQVEVPSDHTVRCQREDLDEMIGNLLDNACKWARSSVRIDSSHANGVIVIAVDDDGPGIPAAMREAVLQRGVRADEAAPGSGLGLAIVRDLAELYGGSIALDGSRAGGVRARLQLPAAHDNRRV